MNTCGINDRVEYTESLKDILTIRPFVHLGKFTQNLGDNFLLLTKKERRDLIFHNSRHYMYILNQVWVHAGLVIEHTNHTSYIEMSLCKMLYQTFILQVFSKHDVTHHTITTKWPVPKQHYILSYSNGGDGVKIAIHGIKKLAGWIKGIDVYSEENIPILFCFC